MNADRMNAKAEALGDRRAEQLRDQLIKENLPQGVRAERSGEGVTLIGKNLRRRMLNDPVLRSFGR